MSICQCCFGGVYPFHTVHGQKPAANWLIWSKSINLVYKLFFSNIHSEIPIKHLTIFFNKKCTGVSCCW